MRLPTILRVSGGLATLALAAGCPNGGDTDVDPDSLDYGTLPPGVTARKAVHVVNNGEARSVGLFVQDPLGVFRLAGGDTVELAEGGSASIVVEAGSETPGSYAGALTLSWDGGGTDVLLGAVVAFSDLDGDRDGVPLPDDCDDEDPTVFPGASESCNGVDDDCDGDVPDDEEDGDADGFPPCDGDCDDGDGTVNPAADDVCNGIDDNCDGDLGEDDVDLDGSRPCDGDCDDGNPEIFPGATEICDGFDDDCDGILPDGEIDADGDGWLACAECDDTAASTYPGADEGCDGVDSDCDGHPAADEADADADGVAPCAGDCADGDPAIFPGAPEGCDGIDTDCDGNPAADEVDGDGDSYLLCDDCDDGDAQIHPGAAEGCDGIDSDCDGLPAADEADADADGFAVCAGDCADGDASVYPGATEICDGLDTDCDLELPDDEVDGDGDGVAECADCDDDNAAVYPGASELCDGLDTDCVGGVPAAEQDGDSDGWLACNGYVDNGAPGVDGGGDCNPSDGAVFPGAAELCNGIDDDCSGAPGADELDPDGDGIAACEGDCAPADGTAYPGATEACDGVDDDCDAEIDEDFDDDDDGYFDETVGACATYYGSLADCDDGDDDIHPGAVEACNGVDDDCSGTLPPEELDGDSDGFRPCEGDCDDTISSTNPNASEVLCDGVDNDCNEIVDDGSVFQEFFVKGTHSENGAQWMSTGAPGFSGPTNWNPPGDGTVYAALGGDFTGDGYLDFILERDPPLSGIVAHMYTSNCQGGFTESSLNYSGGLQFVGTSDIHGLADLEPDGDLDVIGWDWSNGQGWVWLNGGTGSSWTRIPASSSGTRPFDLLYWNPSSSSLYETVALPPVDFTGDGIVDLVECSNAGTSVTTCVVHGGTGSGTFTAGTDSFSVTRVVNGFALADLDGDGLLDMVGGLDDDGDAGQAWMWLQDPSNLGNPSGAGVEAFDLWPDDWAPGPLPWDADGDEDEPGWGWIYPYDWDGDEDIDLLVSWQNPAWSTSRTLTLAVNDGNAGFTLQTIGTTSHQWGTSYAAAQDVVSMPVWP
jgi:hypothetical protein